MISMPFAVKESKKTARRCSPIYGRKLKIVFIPKDEDIVIRTAYDPNVVEMQIYSKFGA